MTNILYHRHFLISTVLTGLATAICTSSARSADGRQNQRPGANAIYLSDLNNCQPQSALSQRARRGVWRTINYETDTFSGAMLVATEESEAPDVTYPVKRAGYDREPVISRLIQISARETLDIPDDLIERVGAVFDVYRRWHEQLVWPGTTQV